MPAARLDPGEEGVPVVRVALPARAPAGDPVLLLRVGVGPVVVLVERDRGGHVEQVLDGRAREAGQPQLRHELVDRRREVEPPLLRQHAGGETAERLRDRHQQMPLVHAPAGVVALVDETAVVEHEEGVGERRFEERAHRSTPRGAVHGKIVELTASRR